MAEIEDANPVVNYTVKELLARLEGKIDAYATSQVELVNAVHGLVPKVDALDERVERLELIQVSKDAVKRWHSGFSKVVYGVMGAAGSFAIAVTAFHIFH